MLNQIITNNTIQFQHKGTGFCRTTKIVDLHICIKLNSKRAITGNRLGQFSIFELSFEFEKGRMEFANIGFSLTRCKSGIKGR